MRPWGAQYRALRDGYSFNTALPVDTDQDPLRVDRQTADVVQLSGDRTTAALKDHGTHVCLVRRPRRAARMQRPSARLSLRQACRRVWLAHGRRGPPLSHGTRACQAAPSCVGGSGAGRCDAAHGSDRRHALTRCVCWRLGRTPIHMEQAGIRAVPCQCLSPGVSTVCDAFGYVGHVHYPGPHGKASAPRAMWVQLGCACCTHFAGCSAGELPASALGAAAEWCVAVRGRTPSTRSTACCCPRARSAPRERAASSAAS